LKDVIVSSLFMKDVKNYFHTENWGLTFTNNIFNKLGVSLCWNIFNMDFAKKHEM